MAKSKFFPASLYQRMSEDLHLIGHKKRTHEAYLRAVRKLADYCQTSPDRIAEHQVRQYFLYIKNDLHYAPGSLRVAVNGIRFFFKHTCKRSWAIFQKLKIPNSKTLPEVITIRQVHQIIDAVRVERIATYLWTVYSMGLRLEEGLNLQVGDIDAARGLVHIHRGKGAKDRYVPLPTSTLRLLRKHWATHRHPQGREIEAL